VTTPTDSEIYLVDSSGWIEYLSEGKRADFFAPYLKEEKRILVPTIVLYEVFKKLLRDHSKAVADRFASQAFRCIVASFDESIALAAAGVSLEFKLAMADAIIYTTAQAYQAQIVTGDLHFRGLPRVTTS
jgi:predicted nucleic acid-binding protein